MSNLILLDSGPLGLVTNPNLSPEGISCTNWIQSRLAAGDRIFIPEIVDYENRRELLRANKRKGLRNLDGFMAVLDYLPLSTAAMRQASEFWAQARQRGIPATDSKALDIDMILVAQAAVLFSSNTIIATTNIRHLSQFSTAKLWQEIT